MSNDPQGGLLPEHYLKRELYRRFKESDEIIDFLEAGSLDGMWFWDLEDQEHEWLSPKFKAVFGYEDHEVPNTAEWWQQNIFPDDLPPVLEAYERHVKDGAPYDQVVRYRHRDGSTVWVRCRGMAIRDEAGRPVRMLGVHTDLTEQMRSLAYIEQVVDTFGDPYGLIDAQGRVVWVNRSFIDTFRLSAAALKGRRLTDLAGGIFDVPAVHSVVLRPSRRANVTRRCEIEVELEGRRRCFQVRAKDLRRPGETAPDALVAFEDVTARRREERRRADSQRELQSRQDAVIRASGELLYDWDPDSGDVAYDNCEATLGYRSDQLLGGLDRWLDLVHPEDREMVRSELERVRRMRTPRRLDYRVRGSDGRFLSVEDRGYFFRRADGSVGRMVGFVVDVSERRQLEESLRQAQKMEAIGRLAGGVAHDFNNLLTAILGYTEMVLGRVQGDPELSSDVQAVLEAGQRAQVLTNQLLTFSRRQVLRPRNLDLPEVVSGLQPLLRRVIGEDVEFTLEHEAEGVTVLCDPGQIEQIVMNLAVNARDAMPEGGQLGIRTGSMQVDEGHARSHGVPGAGAYALVEVRDTGEGMSERTRARIFEPFFTTKAQGRGTGLGLSTVYGIVKQNEGAIWVDSRPGQGATFRVYLPQVEGAAVKPPSSGEQTAPKGGHETVLVVEDDDMVRGLVAKTLEAGGYQVLATGDVDEAEVLARTYEGTIDVLLSDVVLPRRSGRDLARRVQALRPAVRTMFMSGYTDHAFLERAGVDPQTGFLPKPITPKALLRSLRDLIEPP